MQFHSMYKNFLDTQQDPLSPQRGRRPDAGRQSKLTDITHAAGDVSSAAEANRVVASQVHAADETAASTAPEFTMRPLDDFDLLEPKHASNFLLYWRAHLALAAALGVLLVLVALTFQAASNPKLRTELQQAFHNATTRTALASNRANTLALTQSPDDMLPWRKAEIAHIVRAWQAAGPVKIAPYDLSATGRYQMWKDRVNLVIATLNGRGESKRAGLLQAWLNRYETHESWLAANQAGPEPPKPGPVSQTLIDGAGPLPESAFRGLSMQYTCRLPMVAKTFQFHDHPVDPDYPYLLNPNGVNDNGVKLADRGDSDSIFRQAHIDSRVGSILRAVSLREGGFEAVNTYDTGYVSVGFIQFTTMASGRGSLISVLTRMKEESPKEYAHYFHYFGIDVDDSGELTVIDPDNGTVLRGKDAVAKVIADKRLTAVFSHAGEVSRQFQVAQVEQAHLQYFAPDHSFDVPVASVTDYSVPQRPVKTYYYGADAIAKAQQFVVAMNAGGSAIGLPQLDPGRIDGAGTVTSRGNFSRTGPKYHRRVPKAAEPAQTSDTGTAKTNLRTLNSDTGQGQSIDVGGPTEPDLTKLPETDPVADPAPKATAKPTPVHPHSPMPSDLPSAASIKPLSDVGKAPAMTMPYGAAGIPTSAPNGLRYEFKREPDLVGTYRQIFKSGAGQTAIVDRCVQHGFDYGPSRDGLAAKFEDAVAAVAKSKQVTVHDLALAERQLIPVVQNRIDVLHLAQLSQPGDNGTVIGAAPRSRPAHRKHRHSMAA